MQLVRFAVGVLFGFVILSSTIYGSNKPIKIKMFKTDQSTWGKTWTYALYDGQNTPSSYKSIKKDVTVSIDPAFKQLWVCADAGGCNPTNIPKLDISKLENEKKLGNVIALDRNGIPSFKRLTTVKSDIAATKTAKIKVYKTGATIDPELWTIESKESEFGNFGKKSAKDVVGTVTIKANPLIAPKLIIPINRQFFISVTIPGQSNKVETLIPKALTNVSKQALSINEKGEAAIVDQSKISSMMPKK